MQQLEGYRMWAVVSMVISDYCPIVQSQIIRIKEINGRENKAETSTDNL